MKEIHSTQNDTYKSLKQLATSPKHRRRSNQTLLEGVHLCVSFLRADKRPLLLVCTPSALKNPEVSHIIAKCEERHIPIVELNEGNFSTISSVDNGVGVLFLIDIPTQETASVLDDNSLLLEDIQDPGNMGAILRTAAAAGVSNVFASDSCVSVWSPKVLRAGMGAHFALHVHEHTDLAKLITDSTVPVLATSLNATNTVYKADLTGSSAWLFGNEGQGVSDELLALSTYQLIIPQIPEVESLNVAAAVAVCLFEQSRQRTKATVK